MAPADWVEMGWVRKTHGVHGALVLQFHQYVLNYLNSLEQIQMELGSSRVPFFIESGSELKDGLAVTLKGLASEEAAKQWVGCKIYGSVTDLAPYPPFDFHPLALIGYEAVDKLAGALGPMIALEDNPAHTFLVVLHSGKPVLIPFVPAFIQQINHALRRVHLQLPDGLLEVNSLDSHAKD